VIFEIWEDKNSTGVFATCISGHKPGCGHDFNSKSAKLLLSFVACTSTHASQVYYDYFKFGEYKPMLDSQGNLYPEDDEPFEQDRKQCCAGCPKCINGWILEEPVKTVYREWLKRKLSWRKKKQKK